MPSATTSSPKPTRRPGTPRDLTFYATVLAPVVLLVVTASVLVVTLLGVDMGTPMYRVLTLTLLATLVLYLLGERRLLEKLLAQRESTFRVLNNQDELYTEAASEVRRDRDTRFRYVYSASSYPMEEKLPPAVELYVDELRRRIQDPSGSWAIRQVYLVDSRAQLDRLVDRLEDLESAKNYEVRIYTGGQSRFQPLAPLIIGSDIFVAVQDRSTVRGDEGFHADDSDACRIVTDYFHRVWDAAPFRLRRKDALDLDVVQSLKSALP